MCLEVFAVPAEPGRIGPERLAELSGLTVKKRREPVAGALHFSRDGGCACSFLDDNADPDKAVWSLSVDVLEGLALALGAIHEAAHGFTFQATWIGEQTRTEEHVPLKAVLSDIRSNAIRNRHLYRVGRSAANGAPPADAQP